MKRRLLRQFRTLHWEGLKYGETVYVFLLKDVTWCVESTANRAPLQESRWASQQFFQGKKTKPKQKQEPKLEASSLI